MDKEEFQKRLFETFRIEAQEHLQALSDGLLQLEKSGDTGMRKEKVEAVFRAAHSFKGAARSVNIPLIESTCQLLESIFSEVKQGKFSPSKPDYDLFHQTVEILTQYLGKEIGDSSELFTNVRQQLKEVLQPSSQNKTAPPVAPNETVETPQEPDNAAAASASHTTETIRIPAARLNDVLFKCEDLLTLKFTHQKRLDDLHSLVAQMDIWEKNRYQEYNAIHLLEKYADAQSSVRSDETTKESLRRVLHFLDWSNAHLKEIHTGLVSLANSGDKDQQNIDGMVSSLMNELKELYMVPFDSQFTAIPSFIRSFSSGQKKEVEFTVSGGDVKVDRRVMENLKDAYIHLIRNCLDHGIETPEERRAAQKKQAGRLDVSVRQLNSRQIEVSFSDDGRGIDFDKVVHTAVRQKIVDENTASHLSHEEKTNLLFLSGLSTSAMITDMSGRGLGMAIVLEKVKALGGEITVESVPGQGTTFRIRIPVTLASFRGIQVRVGQQQYVFPTANVLQVSRIHMVEIETIENRETIRWNGSTIPLYFVGLVFGESTGLYHQPQETSRFPVVVVEGEGQVVAFAVDEIIKEQEVLVKNLGEGFARFRNVSGAAVIDDTQVVPILHVADLIQSSQQSTRFLAALDARAAEPEKEKVTILVADDSITSRMLVRNILETAGYTVIPAVDGMDAYEKLQLQPVNAVVSDVDMPNMNGLDLARKIRQQEKYKNLPVVLVTSLDSPKDRERGIDVGANAYIVKSQFEESSLLEVLQQLI